ncbi:MAG: hypothetical protein ABWX92_11970 [Mycetocola sp.]
MNQKPNVISTPDAKKHLTTILGLFRAGKTEPLIFGDNGQPEAAIIPYEQFQRLVKYDTEAHQEDQRELLQRKQDSTDNPDGIIEFDDFVTTLDPKMRALLREAGEDGEKS